MFNGILIGLGLINSAMGEEISESQTSYIGATMLEGNADFTFDIAYPLNPGNYNEYAYFSGNTLYVGNEDEHGNMVDAIIEFFWFESSIDRGSDFYVAIVKARSNPGRELWVEDWTNFGASPVLSVEALCLACGSQTGPDFNGAFRWDWAVPFDDYGIDSYGEVVFTNSYGVGSGADGAAGAEGSAMAHGEYTENVDGDISASGNVQVKGYVSSDYRVQTQYQVSLYEWNVETTGTADTMAWDMYLNLSAREEYQAYHEYFLPVQVAEGETFIIDTINVLGSFDNGITQVTPYVMGVSIENIEISAPFWQPVDEEEPVEEETEEVSEPETQHEPDLGVDTASTCANEQEVDQVSDATGPIKSGCHVVKNRSYDYFSHIFILFSALLVCFRRNN